MTFAEARDLSLNLIHQESIAGVTIPGSYNNQQDYLNKIPGLINAAQMDIATTTKPIPAEVTLGELTREEANGWYKYTLPENLWQRRGSGLLVPVPHANRPGELFKGYTRVNMPLRMIGNDYLMLPQLLPDETILEYYRYPVELSANPADDDLLDNVREAQAAVPYYVAAYCVIYDDAFLYASMKNEYENKKASMHDLVRTEVDPVMDVYMDPDIDYHWWG